MTDDVVDRIKSEISCRMFGEHIGMKINRAGYACCPFHREKTPSFRFYADDKGWYCFGCHMGGDVINMAKLYYNTDFSGAVKALADEFSISTAEDSPKIDLNALLRAVKRANDKLVREREQRVRDAIEADYWIAFDQWLNNERLIEKYEPKHIDDRFSDIFVNALIQCESLREDLIDAEQRRRQLYGNE